MLKRPHPVISVFFAALILAGCGHTYPKEKLEESVVGICKREYGLDVKVATVGKTLGVFVPLHNLIDFTFSITKEAADKINDVLLAATRVVVSTDADIDFYCVITHDVRLPEIQVIIIKNVDDVKRFLLTDISRGEYSKRMLLDIRLSPQAQKEKAIRQVFDKLGLDPTWQEQVMDDFFRAEPAALGELGFWNGKFYLKDVTMPEFIAEQIASRVKLEFRENEKLFDQFLIKSSRGEYKIKGGRKSFKIEALVSSKEPEMIGQGLSKALYEQAFKIAGHVTHAYGFEEFDLVEIIDTRNSDSVVVSREKLEEFRKNKVKLDDILRGQVDIDTTRS